MPYNPTKEELFEARKTHRIKTADEFMMEFGKDWRKDVGFPSTHDNYLGKTISKVNIKEYANDAGEAYHRLTFKTGFKILDVHLIGIDEKAPIPVKEVKKVKKKIEPFTFSEEVIFSKELADSAFDYVKKYLENEGFTGVDVKFAEGFTRVCLGTIVEGEFKPQFDFDMDWDTLPFSSHFYEIGQFSVMDSGAIPEEIKLLLIALVFRKFVSEHLGWDVEKTQYKQFQFSTFSAAAGFQAVHEYELIEKATKYLPVKKLYTIDSEEPKGVITTWLGSYPA